MIDFYQRMEYMQMHTVHHALLGRYSRIPGSLRNIVIDTKLQPILRSHSSTAEIYLVYGLIQVIKRVREFFQ